MNFFDFLNAINTTKKDLLKEDPLSEKDYSAFMINRSLSYFPDTLFFANEMNKFADAPKDWQFDFYLNSVKPKKRFSKWNKKDQRPDDAKLIVMAYNYSFAKALEILPLINEENLNELRLKYSTGGK